MLIIGIFATVALAFFGVLYSLLGYNMNFRNRLIERITKTATDANMKKENLLKGKRLYIERENLRPVRVNLYQPQSDKKLPVVFMAHGGSFIDHDADDIDDFCQMLSEEWQVNVVSTSYSKIKAHVTSYPQDEIRDVVVYFRRHAVEYNMDMKHFLLMGFEAGAYLSLIADRSLIHAAIVPSGIIMIDPFIDYVAVSFAQAGLHPNPAALVLSDKDTDAADEYEFELRQADIYILTRRMPHSQKGLLLQKEFANETDRMNYDNTMKWLKETADLFLGRQ